VLHFLDQQVGLHFRDVIKNVLLHVIGPSHFRCHVDSPAMQVFRLVLQPIVMVLQEALSSLFPVTLFE